MGNLREDSRRVVEVGASLVEKRRHLLFACDQQFESIGRGANARFMIV